MTTEELKLRIRNAIMSVPGLPVMPMNKMDMIVEAVVKELEKEKS